MGAEIPVGDSGGAPPLSPEDARRVFEGGLARRAKHGFAGFAGFTGGQLLLGAVLAGIALWAFWVTGKVERISERRIVAVSLSGMVGDFLRTEARSGNSTQQVEADTARFMALMQAVLGERAQRGETVIVGEAVIASSAPDITAEVRGEVGRRMLAGRSSVPAVAAPFPAPPLGAAAIPAEVPAMDAGQPAPMAEAPTAGSVNPGQ